MLFDHYGLYVCLKDVRYATGTQWWTW